MIETTMLHRLRCDLCGANGPTLGGKTINKDGQARQASTDVAKSRTVLPRLASESRWLRLESRCWLGRDPMDVCPMCAACPVKLLVKPQKPLGTCIVMP